jgi:hypothetical protein
MQAHHIAIDGLPWLKRPHFPDFNRPVTGAQHAQPFLVIRWATEQHNILGRLLSHSWFPRFRWWLGLFHELSFSEEQLLSKYLHIKGQDQGASPT